MRALLFSLTFFILFQPLFPIVEYVFNYEYISKELCINKETPIIGCNGKCYLMSELANSVETEKPFSDKKEIIKEFEFLYYQKLKIVSSIELHILQKIVHNNSYSNLYTYLNNHSIFHPPSNNIKV